MDLRGKMNLEELRKSFPELDAVSAGKLLGGGGVDGPAGGGVFGVIDFGELNTVEIFGQGGGSGSGWHGGGGGSDYIDDWDPGEDGGDDQEWGDDEGQGGGDSNPGGSEGGNGENSSGNPGGGDIEEHLIWLNTNTPEQRPYRVINISL